MNRKMVKLYIRYINLEKITIDDIPELWKDKVQEELKKIEDKL